MATYIIGDVQGCYDELMQLLEKLHFHEHSDRLWFAGDVINRGPASLAVLRFLSQLPAHHQIVLGNHDLYFLSVVRGGLSLKKGDTLAELYQAKDRDELTAWLIRQPLALYDSDFNTLVIHAGVLPSWTREMTLAFAQEASLCLQSPEAPDFLAHLYDDTPSAWQPDLNGAIRQRCIINCLTRLRIATPDGKMALAFKRGLTEVPNGFMPWYQILARKSADTHIVFGHWAALLGQTGGNYNVSAIDTGCAWGNGLTAYRLEDGQRFFMPSRPT